MDLTDKTEAKKPVNLRTLTWGDMTWVDAVEPTKEVTRYLAEHYHFNPLDLDDALSRRQVSKIEEYPQYLFIVFHLSVFDKKTRVSSRKQWSAFVGENFLVTLRPPEFQVPAELYRECEINEETQVRCLSQGSGSLLYQILDRAIDRYFKVLDKILSLMEAIEDNVFKEEVETVRELSFLRRDIINQRRVMFPTRVLVTQLEKKLKHFSKIDLTLQFSDLMDHLNKICETLDEYTEVIEVFKDTDYQLSGYRANRTIRFLALLFAVSLPFLVIAVLYFLLPNNINKSNLQFFILVLVIIFILIGVTLYLFRHRRLI